MSGGKYDGMPGGGADIQVELGGGGPEQPLNGPGVKQANAAGGDLGRLDNGAAKVKTLAVLGFLLVLGAAVMFWIMVGLKGADDTDIGGRVSSSLTVIACLQTLAVALAARDLWTVFTQYPPSHRLVTFELQHTAFKQSSLPFAVTLVLFFPALATFTLHSLGVQFWDLFDENKGQMSRSMRGCIGSLIAAFLCCVCVGALHLGWSEWMMRTVFWVSGDPLDMPKAKRGRINASRLLLSLSTFGAGCFYYGTLIWAVSLVSDNSGIITSFVLFTLVLFPFLWVSGVKTSATPLSLLVQDRVQRGRNVACVAVTVVYLSYWVTLLILLLEGVFEQGWWETVAGTVPSDKGLCATGAPVCQLNSARSGTAFGLMGMVFCLCLVYGGRVWLHKLRRGVTLPRQEFPEAVLRARDEFAEALRGQEAKIVAKHDEDPDQDDENEDGEHKSGDGDDGDDADDLEAGTKKDKKDKKNKDKKSNKDGKDAKKKDRKDKKKPKLVSSVSAEALAALGAGTGVEAEAKHA